MTAREPSEKMAARLLGLEPGRLADGAAALLEVARQRTRAVLLEAAAALGLTGVSKLGKEALARRVVTAVAAAAAKATPSAKVAARAKPAAPARATAPAKATPVKPAAPARATAPAKAAPVKPAAPAKATAPRAEAPARKAPRKQAVPAARGAKAEKAPVAPLAGVQAGAAEAPRALPRQAEGSREPGAPAAPDEVPADQDPSTAAKLDLGPAGRTETRVDQIPWGYGQDRVTAAAVDPDRLFAWWEVTDVAIEMARQRLGADGAHAGLALRVYDSSGLIFDGTNAHASFDHRVDRADRQWFFHVGKPTSSAHVEVGMLTGGGAFARIARSGRVDFPRREPARWAPPEWMTVVEGVAHRHAPAPSGAPGEPGHGGDPSAPAGPGGAGPLTWPAGTAPGFEAAPLWLLRQTATGRQLLVGEVTEERVEWREVTGEGWYELTGRAEWQEPATFTSWAEGPLHHPVEVLEPVVEAWRGRSYGFQVGPVTHLVHGPWELVIRNLGATASHAVLARWQVFRSWVTEAGREVRVAALSEAPAGAPPGGSEGRLGASERRWVAGSELRLGGASEAWRRGASELRLRGASELRWMGASERSAGGASERAARRAGEAERRGGSEARLAGASEARLGGASEGHLGASEGRLRGERPAPPDGSYPAVEED